jgi:hypothetical protein
MTWSPSTSAVLFVAEAVRPRRADFHGTIRRVIDAYAAQVRAGMEAATGEPSAFEPSLTIVAVDARHAIAVVVGATGDDLAQRLYALADDETLWDGIHGWGDVHGLNGHHEPVPVFDYTGRSVAVLRVG